MLSSLQGRLFCEFSQGCINNNTLIPQKTLPYLLSNLGQIESSNKNLPTHGHVLSVMTNLLSMVTRGLSTLVLNLTLMLLVANMVNIK